MTLQSKDQVKLSTRMLICKLAHATKKAIYSTSLLSLITITPSFSVQAQTNGPLTASEIDWVKSEDLNPQQQAKLDGACCGLYVEPNLPVIQGSVDADTTQLSAKTISSNNDPDNGFIILQDQVEIFQLDQLVQADYGVYQRNTEIIDLDGNVRIRQPGMLLVGTDAKVNRNTDTSQINNASYVLHQSGIRGSAEMIVYTDAEGVVTIDNGYYTRCEPGDNSWVMNSKSIILNQQKGRGVARNTTLKINNIPIFYTPYLSFPLNDERSSGFLAPSIGNRNDGGLDISIPYYLNLAPNYDATITPRLLSERGLIMNAEGRFRGKRTNQTLLLSYLNKDKLFDENTFNLQGTKSPPEEKRWQVDYDFQAFWRNGWRSSVDFAEISDIEFFQDFNGIGLNSVTQSYIARDAHINYLGKNWEFSASSDNYQLIDPNVSELRVPYNSFPRLNLDGKFESDLGIRYGLDTEYVYYTRDINEDTLTQSQIDQGAMLSGQRLSIQPEISWPLTTPGMFVKPKLKYKYAAYQLTDQAIDSSANPDRGIFVASLDSGLIFERNLNFFDNDYTQTLEPRIYYLYSEFEDQSDMPNFDSGYMAFSFSQLFRDDRFSGKDRVGDANQVTLALSSQFLDNKGSQKANASIGQIFYFSDRKVPPYSILGVNELRSTSRILGDFSYRFNDHWKASSYVEWDPKKEHIQTGNFQFRYQSDINHILNLSYRYRDDSRVLFSGIDRRTIQTDVSGIWPLVNNWGLIGRWNYDHANDRILESIVGVEYDSCCWNVRLIAREWIDQDELFVADFENDKGIFLQFELKGLGNVLGKRVSSILTNGISGYREQEYAY